MFFHARVKISIYIIKSEIDYNSRIIKSLTKKNTNGYYKKTTIDNIFMIS